MTRLLLASLSPSDVVPSQGPDLTGYFLVCVGLIGVMGLLAYGFRRLFGNAIRDRNAKRSLAVLDILPLGGRRRVAVVRCYDRTFALGLGDKEISMLAELDVDDTPKELVRRFPPKAETFDDELAVAEPRPPLRRETTRTPAAAQPVPRATAATTQEQELDADAAYRAELVARIRREGVLG